MKLSYDNTAKVKAESAANSAAIAFFDANTPILAPATCDGYLPPKEGQMAFHASIKSGIATDLNNKTNSLVVRGEFRRMNEWMARPWTDADRQSLYANEIARGKLNEENEKKTLKAYGARRSLVKTFTGK